MIVTSDDAVAERLRRLRLHGGAKQYHHEEIGTNSRLDTLQAAVLLAKLPHLAAWSGKRREHAAYYSKAFAGLRGVTTPVVERANEHIFHQYTLRAERRDELLAHLKAKGIGCAVYYPIPLHRQEPFALTTRDAEAVAKAAATRKVPVLPGHLLLFHPAVEQLRALVAGGQLGQLFYLYGLRLNLGQVRQDENALWSFGPHDVSVALFLLDEAPVRVAAQGHCYLQPKVEDVVFLTMEFQSGVLAHVQLSWLDPHKVRKLTVVGGQLGQLFYLYGLRLNLGQVRQDE